MTERKLPDGKIAIATGAGGSIGESIAFRYADEGACVLAVDLQEPELDRRDGQVATLAPDVAVAEAPTRIRDAVVNAFGRLDILVDNAGICLPGSIEDQSAEIWERALAVNVTAPFLVTQALVPLLKDSKADRVINLGSIMSDFGVCLRHVQTRHGGLHEVAGLRPRPQRDHRQLSAAGIDLVGDVAAAHGRSGLPQILGEEDAAGPDRRSGGCRRSRPVPRDRRDEIHIWRGHKGVWWCDVQFLTTVGRAMR